jgi:hypothetical protein
LIEPLLEEPIGEKMNRIILALALVTFSSFSNAGFDYACLEKCSNEGSSFQYCTSKCSTNDFPTDQLPVQSQVQNTQNTSDRGPQIDQLCLADCTNAKYSEQFCQKRCSF